MGYDEMTDTNTCYTGKKLQPDLSEKRNKAVMNQN